MKTLRLALASFAALAGLAAGIQAQEPQRLPTYPGASCAIPYDVNNLGTAVGSAMFDGSYFFFPVRWKDGVAERLTVTEAGGANAVNDAGTVVGYYDSEFGARTPFAWENGVLQPLAAGHGGVATDINDRGEICGFVYGVDSPQAAVWVNGIRTDLPSLEGGETYALTIDADGVVYGTSWSFNLHRAVPVRWINGRLSTFGSDFSDQGRFELSYIQASGGGKVGGYVLTVENGIDQSIPAIWSDGRYIRLDRIVEDSVAQVLGGNDQGVFVGYCTNAGGSKTATLWTGEGLVRLPGDSTRDWIAFANNESGLVVGLDQGDANNLPGAVLWNLNDIALVEMSSIQALRGQTVTVQASVRAGSRPIAGQRVEFRLGDQPLGFGTTDARGVARRTMTVAPSLPNGNHRLMASMGGGKYVNRILLVGQAPTAMRLNDARARRGGTVTLTATLVHATFEKPLAGQTVRFRRGAVVLGEAVTNSRGRAHLSVPLAADLALGGHRISVESVATTTHRRSADLAVLTVLR